MQRQTAVFDRVGVNGDPPSHLTVHLDAIYDNRKLIGLVVGSMLLIGTAYAFLAKPVYRADILVQVEENSTTSATNILNDVSSMFDVKTQTAGEIAVLGSRLVATQAVDKMNLFIDASPRYFPVIGRLIGDNLNKNSARGVFGFVWGKASIAVSQFDVPPYLYGRSFTLTKRGVSDYDASYRDITIHGTVGQTIHTETPYGPIDLRVENINAQPGATFNVRRFSRFETIEALRKSLTVTDNGRESDIIRASLDGTDPARTTDTLNAVATAYVQQNVQRKSEEAARSITFLETQVPEFKKQLETAENQFNTYRARHGTVSLGEEASTLLQRSVDAQTRRIELEQRRKEMLMRYTGEHPAVRAIDAQLEVAQSDINQIANQAQALPALEQNVFRLLRNVQVDSGLYTSLLNTLEQLRLVKAGKTGNARLVDRAVVPEQPFWPKRTLVICLSFFVGLFAGIAIALTRRQFFDAVNDPYEIEETIGLPVYASVPYSREEARRARGRIGSAPSRGAILAHTSNADPAIESLRGFRTALEFTLLEARNRIVLITGPTPHIGKSFIALNLAVVLGATGKRVLLVDADLHRGHLHRDIGVDRGPGLSDLIQGTCEPNKAIRSDVLSGVDFMPAGSHVPNASDLLSGEKTQATLTRLAAEYDIVLCDAPPVLPAATASQLANLAGTTFLVARQGVTGIGELREAIRKLERIGLTVRGVLVNGLQLRPGRCSYGYGRYRYAAYSYQLDEHSKD